MDEAPINILKKMAESFGPPGFEFETSKIIKEYASKFSDEMLTDKLGSVIFKIKGKSERPHLLIASHMDEVGFVVSEIDDSGFITFYSLGRWFEQTLLSQRVVIRTNKNDVMGVIVYKPIHLLKKEELEKPVPIDKMFIDVGATSKEEVEKLSVRIGDPIVPWSPFQRIMNGKIFTGKALDNRMGAFSTMYTLKKVVEDRVVHPNTIFGAATVQEEVGARGATTVPHVVDPDVAIAVDTDLCGDVPGIKPRDASIKMGKGPSIITFDRSLIPNQNLKEMVIETAETSNYDA